MFVIANNISTRDPKINKIFGQLKESGWNVYGEAAKSLQDLAKKCAAASADALEINLQQHFDVPEAMQTVVNIIQQVTDIPLCLSSHSPETLHTGIDMCKTPPIVNYVSLEEARLKEMLPAIAQHKAQVVLLVSDPAAPTDAKEMLEKAVVLVGAANEVGISNEHIFLDPGLIHIGSDLGPRHLTQVMDFVQASLEAFPTPIKTTCWLSNVSTGTPSRVRPYLEVTLLAMLAGLGLNSVFMNVLEKRNIQTARLIKVFNNETVYADSLIDL